MGPKAWNNLLNNHTIINKPGTSKYNLRKFLLTEYETND